MKDGDEYFIPDPHNGDISGSVNGALSWYSPLLRRAFPVHSEQVARFSSSPIFLDPTSLSISLPGRGEEGEGEGEAAHTERGATETEKK